MREDTSIDNTACDLPPCILVVDDEDAISVELMDWLELSGIAARAAPGAQQAMAILAADPSVTVLLTDLHMPHTSGLALSRAAHAARSEEFALEVVVLTGHATIDHALDAGSAGVIDFLGKPVHLARLEEALDRAHRKAAGRRHAFRATARLARDLNLAAETLDAATQDFARARSAADPCPAPALPALCTELLVALRLIAGGAGRQGRPGEQQALQGSLLVSGCRLAGQTTTMLRQLDGAAPAAPQPQVLDLPDMIAGVVNDCTDLAELRSQQLLTDCPQALALNTEPEGLGNLLRHLLTRLIDTAPTGSAIRVTARPAEGAVQLMLAAASGNQSRRAEAWKEPGSLAAAMAARLGGRLSADTGVDGGQLLTITLPAAGEPHGAHAS